jgi:hypothetical protein
MVWVTVKGTKGCLHCVQSVEALVGAVGGSKSHGVEGVKVTAWNGPHVPVQRPLLDQKLDPLPLFPLHSSTGTSGTGEKKKSF